MGKFDEVQNEISRRSPKPRGWSKEAQLANRKRATEGIGSMAVKELLKMKHGYDLNKLGR